MDSLGEKAGTRERGRRWGEGKINGASKGPEGSKKGPEGDPVGVQQSCLVLMTNESFPGNRNRFWVTKTLREVNRTQLKLLLV